MTFLSINKAKLANFADDNTIYENSTEMEMLLDILETVKQQWNGLNKIKWLLIHINFK